MAVVEELIGSELSEPYSVYTYRYFINNWPDLTYIAYDGETPVGTVVAKLAMHKTSLRGYIAMITVIKSHRRRGIGLRLVRRVIDQMVVHGADEVALEAEVSNVKALNLYLALGFVKDKRLFRYYMHGGDAFRLKLVLEPPAGVDSGSTSSVDGGDA